MREKVVPLDAKNAATYGFARYMGSKVTKGSMVIKKKNGIGLIYHRQAFIAKL